MSRIRPTSGSLHRTLAALTGLLLLTSPAIAATMAVGKQHYLYIDDNGTLWAWGHNEHGQLGNGSTRYEHYPVKIGSGYTAVAAGNTHSLAIKADGTFWAWGSNEEGQLGDTDLADHPQPRLVGEGFKLIAAAQGLSLAVKNNGNLLGWGDMRNINTPRRGLPQLLDTDPSYVALFARPGRGFAIKADSSLWGWGGGNPSLIGYGFRSVTSNGSTDYGVKVDGTLVRWGHLYNFGQCSSGDYLSTPTYVASGFKDFQIDYETGIGIKSDGSVVVLVNGSSSSPSLVANPLQFESMALRGNDILARTSEGKLVFWKGGDFFAAEHGHQNDFRTISAGNNFGLAIKPNGDVWAWGANSFGQLGREDLGSTLSPTKIDTGTLAVASGLWHTLFLKADGSLWARGRNTEGQLGVASDKEFSTDALRVGHGFTAISTQNVHNLALKADGSLWAWGDNTSGQLGDGSQTPRTTPVLIGNGFSAIAAGGHHSLALKTDGSLWAWGGNEAGQLGSPGATRFSAVPVKIGEGYTAIAAGWQHSLALKANGSLWTWGRNQYGQLGAGHSNDLDAPQLVGTGYTAIAAGENFSVALTLKGELQRAGLLYPPAWSGDPQLKLYFETISEQVQAIAAGPEQFIYLKTDGTLQYVQVTQNFALGNAGKLQVRPVVFRGTQPEMSAVVQGPLDRRSIQLKLTPADAHLQKNGHVFIAAAPSDGGLLMASTIHWQPHNPAKPQAFWAGALEPLTIDLIKNADLSTAFGTTLYLGYGVGSTPEESLADLLRSQRYEAVHLAH